MYDVAAMWGRLLLFVSLAVPVLATPAGQAPAGTAPQSAVDHLNRAKRYVSEQKTDLAIAELKQVVALDPGNIEARGNLGVLLYFHGDYAGAVPELRAAVQAQPDLMEGPGPSRNSGRPHRRPADEPRRPGGRISAPCGRESAGRRKERDLG